MAATYPRDSHGPGPGNRGQRSCGTIGTVVQAKERKDPERHLFGLWCVSGEVAMTSDIFYRGPIACGIESKIVDYTSKITSGYFLSTDHVVSVVGTSVLWARPIAEVVTRRLQQGSVLCFFTQICSCLVSCS